MEEGALRAKLECSKSCEPTSYSFRIDTAEQNDAPAQSVVNRAGQL